MSKTKDKKSPVINPAQVRTSGKKIQNSAGLDENPVIVKYFWLIIPVLTVIYYLSSKYSVGFYQDDEVG